MLCYFDSYTSSIIRKIGKMEETYFIYVVGDKKVTGVHSLHGHTIVMRAPNATIIQLYMPHENQLCKEKLVCGNHHITIDRQKQFFSK